MTEGKTKREKGEKNDRIILFDGVCNFCNRVVQFIIKRDPEAKFKFAALRSNYTERILTGKEFTSDQVDFIIYIRNNKIYKKSTAALLILKDLGGIWTGFYLLIIVPRFVRDYFYDKIARKRYRLFGKSETCMIATPELKNRYLE